MDARMLVESELGELVKVKILESILQPGLWVSDETALLVIVEC